MAESLYYISIRRHDGEEVKIRPGGAREHDLLKRFAERLSYVTTRATAVQTLLDLIRELKRDVLA